MQPLLKEYEEGRKDWGINCLPTELTVNLTPLEQEEDLLVLDAYFTREDCAGFAYWFADPLFVDQLVSY